jgi:hypothetical protein
MNNTVSVYKTTFPNGKYHYGFRTQHLEPVVYKLQKIELAKAFPDKPQHADYWLKYDDVDIVATLHNRLMTKTQAEQFIDRQCKDELCLNTVVGRNGSFHFRPIQVPRQYYKRFVGLNGGDIAEYIHADYIKTKPSELLSKVDVANKCGAYWIKIKTGLDVKLEII